MARGSGNLAQAVKERLSIVDVVGRYVNLQRNGQRWVAPCPFHQETKPSFSVSEERGFYYCFGCQAAGDLIDFYCRINGLDFREGLSRLAQEAGISTQDSGRGDREADEAVRFRKQAFQLHDMAREFFTACLKGAQGAECRAYIAKRGLSPEVGEAFGIGWAPRGWQGLADRFRDAGISLDLGVRASLLGANDRDRVYDRFRGRLMFPIRDLSSRTIAFGGRIIDDSDEAKYINSADSAIYKKGEHLYGLYQARRGIAQHKSAMLTEGYMDVVTLHQFGFVNACGVLGTALTQHQVQRLGGLCSSVDLLFDGDNPGRKAALRAAEMFLLRGMRCRVILFPEGEDIDSLLRSAGPDAFRTLQKDALDGLGFCMRCLVNDFSPKEMLDWAAGFLRQLENPTLFSFYASRLAGGLGLSEGGLREMALEKKASPSPVSGQQRRPGEVSMGREERRDREILLFLARFPSAAGRLKEMGVDEIFSTPWARTFWEKICAHGESLLEHLDEKEKSFWVRHRLEPDSGETEAAEFAAVCELVRKERTRRQSMAFKTALRQSGGAGSDADMELLLAHLKMLGRRNE